MRELVDAVAARLKPHRPEEVELEAVYRSRDADDIRRMFRNVKADVESRGLVPHITRRGEEYALFLQDLPTRHEQGLVLPTVLFILTLASTAAAGAIFANGYFGETTLGYWGVLTSPRWLGLGFLHFGVPLVGVLVVHEAAHYVTARALGMQPSKPYFLPLPPPIGFTGTLGAIITVQEPMPDRRALLYVGASGPIAGFAASVVVLLVGFVLSNAQAPVLAFESTSAVTITTPLVYDVLGAVFGIPLDQSVHPVSLAGWVGLLLTAIQLIPAGQLDGGHVARALLGDRSHWVAYASLLGLVILGGLYFAGWTVLAVIVLATGAVHPPPLDDVTPLTPRAKWTGLACAFVFALTFVLEPVVT